MPLGPVELIVIQFPQSQVKGDIVPALKELVDTNTIRIIDLLFVQKNHDGTIKMTEVEDLSDDEFAAFDPISSGATGILSQDDIQQLAAMLENDSSAGLMLFENVWATRFQKAVLNANGRLLLSERIPHAVVEEVMAAREQEMPTTTPKA